MNHIARFTHLLNLFANSWRGSATFSITWRAELLSLIWFFISLISVSSNTIQDNTEAVKDIRPGRSK